jgi:hypothetical protein
MAFGRERGRGQGRGRHRRLSPFVQPRLLPSAPWSVNVTPRRKSGLVPMSPKTAIEEISDEEWKKTLSTNISAMFYIVKSAVTHMREGSSIINTASVNADAPSPHLLAYATTKGAIQNFTGGLAQLLAEKGIRAGPMQSRLGPSGRRGSRRQCPSRPSRISANKSQ